MNILFVSHDANRAGAQLFLYNVMLHLQQQGHGVVLLLINEWGSFREEMEAAFPTYRLQASYGGPLFKKTVWQEIKAKHAIDFVYVNTIASVHLLPEIKKQWNVPVLTHIHELSYSIAQYGVPGSEELLFSYSDVVVACSEAVAANLRKKHESEKLHVIHSFVQNDEVLKIHAESQKEQVLKEFGLDPKYRWAGACGNADWRKAPDIFLQIASHVADENLRFAWIGIRPDDALMAQLAYDADKLGLSEKIAWIAPTPRAVELINAMDVFVLCSREDPFPLVMLEAALCEKPIFTFKNTGGGDEFVEDDAGVRIDYLHVQAMAAALEDTALLNDMGQKAQAKVLHRYSFSTSMKKVESLIEKYLKAQ
jgi:glycosyltransferase involved in cell wall biosynthesis